jgi:predicted nucleic acid-binding protein
MSQGSLAPATQLFLLDTSVIIHLVRGTEVCQRILRSYDLIHCQPRPLVCVVSLAEVRVLAAVNHWGERKRQALERTLQSLVVVDIHARQHPIGRPAYGQERSLDCSLRGCS